MSSVVAWHRSIEAACVPGVLGPRRLPLPFEGDVRSPDARIIELWNDDQWHDRRQRRNQRGDQLLKCRRQPGFGGIGMSAQQLPDTAGIGFEIFD